MTHQKIWEFIRNQVQSLSKKKWTINQIIRSICIWGRCSSQATTLLCSHSGARGYNPASQPSHRHEIPPTNGSTIVRDHRQKTPQRLQD